MRLQFPDKKGNPVDLVAGFDSPESYNKHPYTNHNFCIGATIGRYAGRISGGGFPLKGTFYPLEHDQGVHLHGGNDGFDKQFWNLKYYFG